MGILQFLKRHYTPRNCLFFLFFVMTVFYVWARIRQREFSQNKSFSIAKINGASPGHQYKALGPIFYYSYTVNGKIYGGFTGAYMTKRGQEYKLIGKYFPVAYNKLHPDRSYPLILPGDFIVNKLEQPDSLKWVNDIVW